jgi:peptidylprolyl isomerase
MIFHRYGTTLALLALTTAATAQTSTPAKKPATPPTATHAAPTTTAAAPTAEQPCAKLPDLSPKIPALPAGLPCAKPLYTIVTSPQARVDYAAPIANSLEVAKYLGIEPVSISLNYVDVQVGTGELAVPHKWFKVNYTGYLTDGTKFDSSLDRNEPISIPYGGHKVIPGWDTGFGGMRIGGKRRLFIPYQLAYGSQGKPPVIPAQAELIFDVELVSQSDTEPAPKPAPAPAKPADSAAPADQPAKPDSAPETTPKPQGL